MGDLGTLNPKWDVSSKRAQSPGKPAGDGEYKENKAPKQKSLPHTHPFSKSEVRKQLAVIELYFKASAGSE